MRLLLVRPPRPEKSITLGEFMFCEPLGLEVAATMIGDLCDVTIFDMMTDRRGFSKIIDSVRPAVVGFTTLCIDVENALRLCREAKQLDPQVVTLVGGTQTFFNQEAFFSVHVDHVFQYTTRENLRGLLMHLREKEAVPLLDGVLSRTRNFKGTGVPGRNGYVHPDISFTAEYRTSYRYLGYRPCAIMQTSTGCHAMCAFCLRWRLEGGAEQAFSLEGVVQHVESLPEPNVMIIDNDFFNDPQRIGRFCDHLERRGIRKNFICYASVRGVLENERQLERLVKNGLRTVLVGYETFSDEELGSYKKESSRDACVRAAAVLKKYRMDCWASFIVHPDWTVDDFKTFRQFVKSLSPEISTVSPLTPFPGLPLYHLYKDRLLPSPQEFGRWSFGEVTVRPASISLKRYYCELLKTILYINLRVNDTRYMVKCFGIFTCYRLLKGSVRVLFRYVRLMIAC